MIRGIYKILRSGAWMSAAVLAVSITALGAALIAEHVFGLAPCVLCIYQRIPYAITALLGILGITAAARGKTKITAAVLFLSALVFLAGAAIAFYHTGVEQHWWASAVEGCKIDFSQGGDLLAQIEASQAVRCDEIPWADPVFGLSMAAWNVFASLFFFGAALFSASTLARQNRTDLYSSSSESQ